MKSLRKESYRSIEAVEAPDPYTVRFRLKYPEASFLLNLASPWNWIYKADILAKDMHWYETNVMGTGPFIVRGARQGLALGGQEEPELLGQGQALPRRLPGHLHAAPPPRRWRPSAASGRRSSSAASARRSVTSSSAALGNKITVQESPWDCLNFVSMHHEKKPFDDKRVRRALSLALDRYEASQKLSKITIVKDVGGIQVPGTPYATPPAELEKLAGYGHDINANRAEAKRLLREAGVPDGFSFTFKNRGIPHPYEPIGIWLIDQWRQIGLNVKIETIEASAYHPMLKRGRLRGGDGLPVRLHRRARPGPGAASVSHVRRQLRQHKDKVIDELYEKQARAADVEERKKHRARSSRSACSTRRRTYIYTLQWHRIIPHSAKVQGWTITPSHYLNNQLDTVWLSE